MFSMWDEISGMAEDLGKVKAIIQSSLDSKNRIINEGLQSLFSGGGKLLRPGMLLVSARFGTLEEKHYQFAAAIEMLHMATLIHDDVIDDSPVRRGLPSLHSRYGRKDAVLMGDFLLSRCFLLVSEYTSSQDAVTLAKAIAIICQMEIEQNNDRFRSSTSFRHYLRKIMGKSALLFSLACHTGAQQARVSDDVCQRLRRIGYNIGMTFQIIDDILDYSGDEKTVGKTLGNDIRSGLVTLPLLCALRMQGSEILKEIFSKDFFLQEQSNIILSQVRNLGGDKAALEVAGIYTKRALKDITALPPCDGKDILQSLTRRLLVRQA
ncbi:MAG: polyprenyl synthetase family protein [Treponema sp.]|jgi:heptaprenyl diphosphate synthase|nr:polyprenyl synthetase family protein [Treponema sp.]